MLRQFQFTHFSFPVFCLCFGMISYNDLHAQDCNGNQIPDACDISCGDKGGTCDVPGCGMQTDCDANLVPDVCQLQSTHSALDFDGVDDWIRVPRSSSLEPTLEVTIEVWMKPNGPGGSHNRIARMAGDFAAGYILSGSNQGDGRAQMIIYAGTQGSVFARDTVPLNTYVGNWVHLAGVYSASGNYCRLYVNGQLRANEPGVGLIQYSGSDLYLGNYIAASTESFDGVLDEFRIWRVARAQEQIVADMDRSLTGSESGLAALWHFDDGTGQTVSDSSPNNNDGFRGLNVNPNGDSRDPVWVSPGAPLILSDCNSNGALDSCELAAGTSSDCNGNDVPDECDGGSECDCNGNGLPDVCDLDCDGNVGTCGLQGCGLGSDCNENAILDECEFFSGPREAVMNPTNGHYYYLTPNSMSWPTAETLAISLGGHLVSIVNQAESQWLISTFGPLSPDPDVFIGMNDTISEGTWVWSSGEEVTYTNWYPGEPNNSGNEDWANVFLRNSGLFTAGQWNDISSFRRGIVEIDAFDCNLNGMLDSCDINSGVSIDCNGNQLPDECESLGSNDCDDDGVSDLCEFQLGAADCNSNDVPDSCDVNNSGDCNLNLIPDDCETDCNGNAIPDDCDLANCPADNPSCHDCNANTIPDGCDLNNGPIVPPPGSLLNPSNGHAYLFYPAPMTWPNAEAQAVSMGGHLASIASLQENQWIMANIAPLTTATHAFIGLNDIANEGQFAWSSGEAVTFTNWIPGEPNNNNGSEDWVEMVINESAGANFGRWNDWPGNRPGIFEFVLSNDCNQNGVIDECDIASGVSRDCNHNGVPDECSSIVDCNQNDIHDQCDVESSASDDCNSSGVPDECELVENDCNENVVPDDCEDCNKNGLADECDIETGSSHDCNSNSLPDDCEDCNGNALADECDLENGTSPDFDENGVPDECQPDCNENNLPDFIDIALHISDDCNANDIPDECDLESESSPDCNVNNKPDECDVAGGLSDDCQSNGVPDECDTDSDGDGHPNDCDLPGDFDHDSEVDLDDYAIFSICFELSGPLMSPPFDECLDVFDAFPSDTVDLRDFAQFVLSAEP